MTSAAEETRNAKRVRTFRMWDDTWRLIGNRGSRDAASTLVNDMTEAGLGFARCYRCFEPVRVEFRDLTGRPLAEWVAEAGETVTAQKCDAHQPVTIGASQPDGTASAPAGKASGKRPAPREDGPAGSRWLEPVDEDKIPAIADVLNPRRKGRGR